MKIHQQNVDEGINIEVMIDDENNVYIKFFPFTTDELATKYATMLANRIPYIFHTSGVQH